MSKTAFPPPSLNEFFELSGSRKRSGAFHSSVQAKGTVAWTCQLQFFLTHITITHIWSMPKALMVNSTKKMIICSKPLKIWYLKKSKLNNIAKKQSQATVPWTAYFCRFYVILSMYFILLRCIYCNFRLAFINFIILLNSLEWVAKLEGWGTKLEGWLAKLEDGWLN